MSRSEICTELDFVILNAVKNLVLHPDVSPFLGDGDGEKGGIWVLRDEILHCVQNDKGHLLPLHSTLA
jgi:hypothetical protein